MSGISCYRLDRKLAKGTIDQESIALKDICEGLTRVSGTIAVS